MLVLLCLRITRASYSAMSVVNCIRHFVTFLNNIQRTTNIDNKLCKLHGIPKLRTKVTTKHECVVQAHPSFGSSSSWHMTPSTTSCIPLLLLWVLIFLPVSNGSRVRGSVQYNRTAAGRQKDPDSLVTDVSGQAGKGAPYVINLFPGAGPCTFRYASQKPSMKKARKGAYSHLKCCGR